MKNHLLSLAVAAAIGSFAVPAMADDTFAPIAAVAVAPVLHSGCTLEGALGHKDVTKGKVALTKAVFHQVKGQLKATLPLSKEAIVRVGSVDSREDNNQSGDVSIYADWTDGAVKGQVIALATQCGDGYRVSPTSYSVKEVAPEAPKEAPKN